MTTISIIYWYDAEHLPRDGGGLRALAWKEALQRLGAKADIIAIHPGPVGESTLGLGTKIKRTLAPMPFSRTIAVPDADLIIATVPGIFPSLAKRTTGRSVIFDWMDRWSISARTMGNSSIWSRPGGQIQSHAWQRKETWLPKFPLVNTFAGYADLEAIGSPTDLWLPTPVTPTGPVVQSSNRRVRTVGFLGNLNYEPNEFSLRDFLRRYSAEFERRQIRITVGGFGSERVAAWGYNVAVVGAVPNLADFYSSIDAAVVPIEHGGGIKVKAIESLAYGVPVIGTSHVRSGFPPSLRTKLVVDIDEFLSSTEPSLTSPHPTDILRIFSARAFEEKVRDLLSRVLPGFNQVE